MHKDKNKTKRTEAPVLKLFFVAAMVILTILLVDKVMNRKPKEEIQPTKLPEKPEVKKRKQDAPKKTATKR